MLLAVSLTALVLLTSCGKDPASESVSSSAEEEESAYSAESIAESAESVESAESTASSAEGPQEETGFTVEECKNFGGVFRILPNGTFLVYNTFRGQLDQEWHTISIETLHYNMAMHRPIDQLYFYMWPEYSENSYGAFLFPITGDNFFPSLSVPGEDGTWTVESVQWNGSSDDDISFRLSQKSDLAYMKIDTIDGAPANTVPFKRVLDDFYWYAFPESYKDKTITLGYAAGTTLTEQTCVVDHYLGTYNSRSLSTSTDDFTITPTTDGYAVMDLQDVPEGLYVLEISISGGPQYATLVNVAH